MKQIQIQEIPFASPLYQRALKFREEILRLPLGLTLSAEDTEGEDKKIHIAAIEDSATVVGTVVLTPLSADCANLCQMAVSPSLQKTGIGKKLVQFAEALARRHGFKTIEMSARVSARGFYEKLGYSAEGEPYKHVKFPPAVKMLKSLF